MEWQMAVVGVIVAAAGAYLGRGVWRAVRGAKTGCGGGCKCPSPPAGVKREELISANDLTARLRPRR